MICSREPLSEKVAAEDALRMEIAAFVENHIEALVNALVHIAVVDAHTPPPIRARAKKALSALTRIELRAAPSRS